MNSRAGRTPSPSCGSVRFASSRCPVADALEVFDGDPAPGAFGLLDDPLADHVVLVLPEPGLLPGPPSFRFAPFVPFRWRLALAGCLAADPLDRLAASSSRRRRSVARFLTIPRSTPMKSVGLDRLGASSVNWTWRKYPPSRRLTRTAAWASSLRSGSSADRPTRWRS